MGIKKISLRRYFTIYCVRLCLLPIAILAADLFLFSAGMNAGIIQYANSQEKQIKEQRNRIASAPEITPDLIPDRTKYVQLAKDGQTILDRGNMTDKEIRQAISYLQTNTASWELDQPGFTVIETADGVCIIRYSLIAKFTNPLLNTIMPYPWLVNYFSVFPCIFSCSFSTADASAHTLMLN